LWEFLVLLLIFIEYGKVRIKILLGQEMDLRIRKIIIYTLILSKLDLNGSNFDLTQRFPEEELLGYGKLLPSQQFN
jgi:hypothetical protein